jgi:hypothetical protein
MKVDRVGEGYYFVHFDPPMSEPKLFSINLVTEGADNLSYGFVDQSKWVPTGNELLLSIRTYVCRGDFGNPQPKDAYQVMVAVWQ